MISSTDLAAHALLTISGNVPRQTTSRGILYQDPSVHPRWEDRFRSGEWALKHHIHIQTTQGIRKKRTEMACFFQMKTTAGLNTLLYVGEVDGQLYPKGTGTLYKSSDRTEFLVDNSASEAVWKDFFQRHKGKTHTILEDNRRVYSYTSDDWDKFEISGVCEYSESKCIIHGWMVTEDGKYIFNDDNVHIEYKSGDKFEGRLYHHDVHQPAKGFYKYENGATYRGTFPDRVNGKLEHYGTYVDKDKSTYTGWFRDDVKHGEGILLFTDGDRFEGTWEIDVPVFGTMTKHVPFDGQMTQYVGPVTASFAAHGEGTLTTFSNGQRLKEFKGKFIKGKRCGKGEERRFNDVAMASNGDSFRGTSLLVGEWRDDKFYNGRSTFSHEDSALNYAREGTFQDNEVLREGKYYHPDGAVYEGSFDMNGQASGLGMLTQPGGTIECGEWKNNKRNGTFQSMQRGLLASPGTTPPDYFYTSRVVQYRDNEIVEEKGVDTKKRQRDFDEFETSCRKRVRV